MINPSDIRIGDKMIDNDPRMSGRILTITGLFPNGVSAKDSIGRHRVYLAHRLFSDGKQRRYGFNIVPQEST